MSTEARGGEVGGTGDDVAGLVFVKAFGDEEVDLGVEAFGGVGFDFHFLGDDVVYDLEDSGFDLGG